MFLCVLIISGGCSTDQLTPCMVDGAEGELCREYRYYNDAPTGYVTFNNEGDSVALSDYYNQNSKLIKTVKERFENGQTKVVTAQFPNEASRVQTWHYNEIDSLWRIVFGANDSVVEISYENGKREREAYFHAGELDRYFDYRYYQDDGKLYRIYAYGNDSIQLSYRNFEYFSTGQNRVSHFTANHRLIGRRVYRSQNGLIRSIELTDSAATVTERTDYLYDAASNLTEKIEVKAEQTYKSVFLYY